MKRFSVYLWAFVALAFISFIGLMSYWYPVTLDEYFRWGKPFKWELIKSSYFAIVPRISMFLSIPIFVFDKWFFILINSIVQLANCLCIFYILFVRLPNYKDLKDMPYFLIILLMSIFFVCTPSEVMFWVSGAINYTWTILFFLIMLCFLRQIQTNKVIFKNNWIFKIFLFILGFLVGMSNESLAPVALGLVLCFALFYEYKKIQTPRILSFLIFGLAIGCLVFFSAPAHYSKMALEIFSGFSSFSLNQKLFFHIYHLNELFKAQFYLFFVIILFLFVASIDKDKKTVNKSDLWLSLVFVMLSFLMAFILFIVPQSPLRAYYPASMLCLMSFLFLVKYYIHAYKFDFSKWLCYIIVVICLLLSPRFILPHYFLHVQEKGRNLILQKIPNYKAEPYIVLEGPTENLTIGLMDPARRVNIGDNMYITNISPVTKW